MSASMDTDKDENKKIHWHPSNITCPYNKQEVLCAHNWKTRWLYLLTCRKNACGRLRDRTACRAQSLLASCAVPRASPGGSPENPWLWSTKQQPKAANESCKRNTHHSQRTLTAVRKPNNNFIFYSSKKKKSQCFVQKIMITVLSKISQLIDFSEQKNCYLLSHYNSKIITQYLNGIEWEKNL